VGEWAFVPLLAFAHRGGLLQQKASPNTQVRAGHFSALIYLALTFMN
jgi:hypothetical protein